MAIGIGVGREAVALEHRPRPVRARPARAQRVVYLLDCFPVASQTWIPQELQALAAAGREVRVIAIHRPPRDKAARDALGEAWGRRTEYLCDIGGREAARAHWRLGRQLGRAYHLTAHMLRRHGGPRSSWRAPMAAGLMRGHAPDYLHTHFPNVTGALIAVVAGLLRVPWGVTMHHWDIYKCPPRDLPGLIERAAFLCTVSDYNRSYLLETFPALRASKLRVNHPGIDCDKFAPVDGGGSADRNILSVGRLVPDKNYAAAVRICRRLVERGMRVTWRVVGGGPCQSEVGELVRSHGLSGRFVLLGPQPHDSLPDLYRDSSAFVMTSVSEGLPSVLMESMACGVPVVAPRLRGIPELVRHGVNGFLFDTGDEEAATAAVARLLADRKLARRMGRAGRQLVRAEYNVRANAEGLIAMMDAAVGEHRASRALR